MSDVDSKELHRRVMKNIEEGLRWKDLRALRHATHVVGSYHTKQWLNDSFQKYPSLKKIYSTGPDIRKRLREIKEYSIDHLDELLPSAKEMLEFNDASVYMAKDAQDTLNYIDKNMEDGITATIPKTSMPWELGLEEFLDRKGVILYRNDTGARTVQLLNGDRPPGHGGTWATYATREQQLKAFSNSLGVDIPKETPRETIIKYTRKEIQNRINEAQVGFAGTSAIAADCGAMFFAHNEGNITQTIHTTPKLFVLAGIDKVVPGWAEGMHIAATYCVHVNFFLGRIIDVICGPSSTDDIRIGNGLVPFHRATRGAEGAKEIHVVMIDNGRRKALENGFKEMLYCINCNACIGCCPAYVELGEKFKDRDFSGKGLVQGSFIDPLAKIVECGLYSCTGCGKCKQSCPANIDIPRLIEKVRARAVAEGLILEPHKAIASNIEKMGNPFGELTEARSDWIKEQS
jgi:L-lactate dehydrogenase complex protein LldF